MTRKAAYILLLVFAILSLATVGLSFAGVLIPPLVTILLTILAFFFALLHSAARQGWRLTWLLVGATFVVSLVFESVGVATGLIYGPYHYTDKLGPAFLGLVPYLIPLAWFMMMYPAYLIAVRIIPDYWKRWQWALGVAAVGALVMTAWDVAMDPFMSHIGHWVWDVDGAYYGVPLQNYWGWWLTSFVTLGLFVWAGRVKPGPHLRQEAAFDRLAVFSFALNALNSCLTDINLGLNGAALAGLFATLPWIIIGLLSTAASTIDGQARPERSPVSDPEAWRS
jgi:putative membrane protein